MALPHTTKKHTTTTKSTSRRAHHSPTKRAFQYTDEEITTHNADHSETKILDDPAALEGPQQELQNLVIGMVDAQRARHRVRKQDIYAAYDAAHSSTQQAVNTLFDEHEAKASEAHDTQLRRLQDLIKKKGEIEKAMDEKVGAMRAAYKGQWLALRKVVKKRLEEVS